MIYNDKKQVSPCKVILVVLGCVIVNFLGRSIAVGLQLPLWLDSIGTVFSAYVLGPFSGAIVGCTGTLIYSMWNPQAILRGERGYWRWSRLRRKAEEL